MEATAIHQVKNKVYSVEEYYQLEEKAIYKSEFHNGKLVPMSGGTIEHGKIGGNIYFFLRMLEEMNQVEWEVFNSDQKIYIPAINQILYSDTCVVSEEVATYKGQSITNPCLVFDVLSKSTAGYDRGGKFRKYKLLPSFVEYVLVDQYQPIVDVFLKKDNNQWLLTTYTGLDALVPLQSIKGALKMKDIYKNVPNKKIQI